MMIVVLWDQLSWLMLAWTPRSEACNNNFSRCGFVAKVGVGMIESNPASIIILDQQNRRCLIARLNENIRWFKVGAP
jgi:hypothetical protein